MLSSPILVAGLDSRSLLLEAPFLLREGAPITEATSAWDLMERLAREGGRLVVLGTEIEDAPLVEVIRRIRGVPSTRHVSLLALIPSGEPDSLDGDALDAGANAVLRRPLDRAHLEAWLAKLLAVPRRVDARIPVQGQVVGTRRDAIGGHFYGLSRNLSVNGMLLASPVRLAGSDLDIEFQLPETGRRVRAIGRVVREARDVAWPYLGYGVEFVFVPPDSMEGLVGLVTRHLPLPPLPAPPPEGPASRIVATVRHSAWIYEIVEPTPYATGFLVEIRRGAREGWRPGAAGPYFVVEGVSAEAAMKSAREFVARHR
ncbi:MAG TPA: PilZ domain-containing protein [Vicinamibacteria bacterium]